MLPVLASDRAHGSHGVSGGMWTGERVLVNRLGEAVLGVRAKWQKVLRGLREVEAKGVFRLLSLMEDGTRQTVNRSQPQGVGRTCAKADVPGEGPLHGSPRASYRGGVPGQHSLFCAPLLTALVSETDAKGKAMGCTVREMGRGCNPPESVGFWMGLFQSSVGAQPSPPEQFE